MPLFGHTTTLRIFIDPDLLQYDEVLAASGTWNDVLTIAPNDLVRARKVQAHVVFSFSGPRR